MTDKTTLPDWLHEMLEKVESEPRPGRRRAEWHRLAFVRVDELVAQGMRQQDAVAEVAKEYSPAQNIVPRSLWTLYMRDRQRRLSKAIGDAFVERDRDAFEHAVHELWRREKRGGAAKRRLRPK